MRRRCVLAGATALAGAPARAQRVARLGVLGLGDTEANASRQLLDGLREGLRELGHVEGRHFSIEYRSAAGEIARFDALAAELVRREVDLIVALSNGAVHAARRATQTIPIVSFSLSDPVGEGFAASLARPGGNVTGFTVFAPELAPKALSLLVEAKPGIRRIAALWSPGSLGERVAAAMLDAVAMAAGTLGVALSRVVVSHAIDLASVFAAIARDGNEALLVLPSPHTNTRREEIAGLAMRHALPAIGWTREFAETGLLLAYGSNLPESWRRGARYVDLILRGARPAELPIEQPTRFELVVNQRTARALDLTLPATLLARADEVIE